MAEGKPLLEGMLAAIATDAGVTLHKNHCLLAIDDRPIYQSSWSPSHFIALQMTLLSQSGLHPPERLEAAECKVGQRPWLSCTALPHPPSIRKHCILLSVPVAGVRICANTRLTLASHCPPAGAAFAGSGCSRPQLWSAGLSVVSLFRTICPSKLFL